MPYIGAVTDSRFHDPIFFYKSDEKKTYYCDPACYKWIEMINKQDRLDEMNWMHYLMPIESMSTIPLKNDYDPFLSLTHLQEFPLKDQDTPYLISIYNFFKGFESGRNYSDKERLERAIVFGSYPKVPNELMERLVNFTFYHCIDKKEYLRVSLSDRVRPLLKKRSEGITE